MELRSPMEAKGEENNQDEIDLPGWEIGHLLRHFFFLSAFSISSSSFLSLPLSLTFSLNSSPTLYLLPTYFLLLSTTPSG